MKQAEQQQLLEAIATLDQFAANTPLPRLWHANWQTVYQQVVARMHAMTIDTSEDTADASPPP